MRFPIASRIICAYKMSMSTLNTRKKQKGRPRVESEEVRARVQQPLLRNLDAWAETSGVTRAEAIRRLLQIALENPPCGSDEK